jgi:flavin reductase (DIM6/NTAB) family NADH-FMN oxidoreductase RutF
MLDTQTRPFSDRQFRQALGLFPTGVAVVTGLARDQRKLGVTVNSFTSVSLSPPLISFNLDKKLKSIDEWLSADFFAVHFLAEGQEAISGGFACAEKDKWIGLNAVSGVTPCPLLQSKLAVFECEQFAHHEAGDHFIMIGKVLHFSIDQEARPLLYHGGSYRRLAQPHVA